MEHARLASYLLKQCTTVRKLKCCSASVGKSNSWQASSYGMLPTMIWRARRWTFSSYFNSSFVRLVWEARQAYSRIGRITAWKKYARSSLATPAHFWNKLNWLSTAIYVIKVCISWHRTVINLLSIPAVHTFGLQVWPHWTFCNKINLTLDITTTPWPLIECF